MSPRKPYSGAYRDDRDRIRPITPRKRSTAKTGVPVRVRTITPTRKVLQDDYEGRYRRIYITEYPQTWGEPSHLDDVPEKVWEYAYLNERSPEPEENPLRYIDVSDTKTPTLENIRDRPDYFRDRKGVEYEIKLVSPSEFFNLCSQVPGYDSARKLRLGVNEERAKKYADAMLRGERFALPWIDYDFRGQEGRHRARALELIGVKFFPVMIVRGIEDE